ARRKIQLVRVEETLGCAELAPDVGGQGCRRDEQTGPIVRNVNEWTHVLVAQSQIHRGGRGNPPRILDEQIAVPLPQVHVWRSYLTLANGGQGQFEAGQGRAR